MSEDKKAEGKKKGGKMPVILALVLVLGGGGFFMMKGKKEPPKEPELELAKEEILLPDEFIVNLGDGKTYIRAKVGLRAKKDYKAEAVTKHDAEISDAINMVLKNTKPDETVTEAHMKAIKRKIAEKINKILEADAEDHGEKKKKKKKKKKKTESSEESSSHGKEKDSHDKDSHGKESDSHDEESTDEEEEEENEVPEDWDSPTGPILKVFFKAFATQ